jgi:hypothetical protein
MPVSKKPRRKAAQVARRKAIMADPTFKARLRSMQDFKRHQLAIERAIIDSFGLPEELLK